MFHLYFFFFQAEDGIRDYKVTGVQTCALPISVSVCDRKALLGISGDDPQRLGSEQSALADQSRSEEHTSELQSPCNLVCRLLLEKRTSDQCGASFVSPGFSPWNIGACDLPTIW